MHEVELFLLVRWLVNDSKKPRSEIINMLDTLMNYHRTALVVGYKEASALDPELKELFQEFGRSSRLSR